MLFATVIGLGLLAVAHAQCALKTIGFSALLNQDVTVGINNRVMYNKVITNHGNTFESSTGQFTAPLDGIFIVHMNFLSQNGTEAYIDLVKNDEYVLSAYAYQASTFDAAGNSVVLKLKDGDILFTKAHRESKLYGRTGEVYNTFSVYLIASL